MANTNRQETAQEINLNFVVCLNKADEYAEKFVRIIPNGLKLANLACGLFSLIAAMNGLYRLSSLCIIFAALCNFFDGRRARTTSVSFDVGTQLDLLAEVVSFGVAPAILAHSIKRWSFMMIIAFISFPLAGAWRLAKSNVHPERDCYIGLPISIAGIVIALLALFSFVSPIIMIVLALLMISPLQMPKL